MFWPVPPWHRKIGPPALGGAPPGCQPSSRDWSVCRRGSVFRVVWVRLSVSLFSPLSSFFSGRVCGRSWVMWAGETRVSLFVSSTLTPSGGERGPGTAAPAGISTTPPPPPPASGRYFGLYISLCLFVGCWLGQRLSCIYTECIARARAHGAAAATSNRHHDRHLVSGRRRVGLVGSFGMGTRRACVGRSNPSFLV